MERAIYECLMRGVEIIYFVITAVGKILFVTILMGCVSSGYQRINSPCENHIHSSFSEHMCCTTNL